jgi:hypothetical protein
MSKFINSAVNYSETDVLKSKYLSSILELYNQYILTSTKSRVEHNIKYIIPNNNKKYYLFIINKNAITANNMNSKYKICYFFPDNNNYNNNQNDKSNVEKHISSDFYMEIDIAKTKFDKNSYLFEGYLYNTTINTTNTKTFLVTDILAIDSNIVNCNYSLRYSLINQILLCQNLNNLNGHFNIGIHSVFDINNEQSEFDVQVNQLFEMFSNNFMFKDEINSIEYIDEISLKKTNKILKINKKSERKRISKGKYIDVYNVFNINTNNHENILYVKTLNDSKKLIQMLESKEYIELDCTYNTNFKKWQPIFI